MCVCSLPLLISFGVDVEVRSKLIAILNDDGVRIGGTNPIWPQGWKESYEAGLDPEGAAQGLDPEHDTWIARNATGSFAMVLE